MSDKVIKCGVVGLGRGTAVARGLKGLKNAKLVAVCDHNPKILKSGYEELSEVMNDKDILQFSDYDEMLKTDIDAVIVATEAVYHVPIVIKAFEAGKHVLCEIPSVNSIEEAKELKEATKKYPHLTYMAAENCCYWAFIETWRKMNQDGLLGEIAYAEAEYLHALDPNDFAPDYYPENHWRTYQPAIRYLTHELGPLLYVMDDRCVSVTCMEADINYDPYTPERKETGVALFKTAKGAVIRLLVSFGAYTSYDHNYRVCGTRGTLETDRRAVVDNAHTLASLYSVPGTFSANSKMDIPVTTCYEGEDSGGHGGADGKMVKDFINCLVENKKPVLDVDFAIQMSLPGIIAHESAVQGGVPLEIPQF